MLAAILAKLGHEPIVVEDGLAAAAALERTDAPPLVLLDWNMPGLEGPEVCRRLRQAASVSPPYVILLTARGAKDDVVRGLGAGANDYIAKPYDVGELMARIAVGTRMLELQTELVNARNALQFQALHDPLTGLPNRRALLERLTGEFSRAQREESPLAVGMCDLDHFKRINDTHGHAVGDAVLVAFARVTGSTLRVSDVVGRYGGEEFLVIAPGSAGTPGEGLFERVAAYVAAHPVTVGPQAIPVTVSIGVAGLSGSETVDSLLAAADAALYRAKAEGRNRVCFAPQPPRRGTVATA